MKLRYVKGSEMTVNFGDEGTGVIEHTSVFSPECEVPDRFVERLMARHPGDYVKVEAVQAVPATTEAPAQVKCDVCQKPFKNAQGVIIHKKRMHKEQ